MPTYVLQLSLVYRHSVYVSSPEKSRRWTVSLPIGVQDCGAEPFEVVSGVVRQLVALLAAKVHCGVVLVSFDGVEAELMSSWALVSLWLGQEN